MMKSRHITFLNKKLVTAFKNNSVSVSPSNLPETVIHLVTPQKKVTNYKKVEMIVVTVITLLITIIIINKLIN